MELALLPEQGCQVSSKNQTLLSLYLESSSERDGSFYCLNTTYPLSILEGACSPPCFPWPPSIRRSYCRMYLSQARLCLSRYQRRHCGHTEKYIFELRYFRNVSELFQPHDPSFPKNKKVSRLSRNCGVSIICSESSEPSELETHAFGRTHQPGSSSPLELLL